MFDIIEGDCIKILETVSSNSKIDGVITSPPYNLGKNPRHTQPLYDVYVDEMSDSDYIDFSVTLFTQLDRIIKPKGTICYNMGISTKNAVLPFKVIAVIAERTNFTIGDVIYWEKKTCMPFQTSPNKSSNLIEPIYVFCKKDAIMDFQANKPVASVNEKTGQKFYPKIVNHFIAANGKSTEFNHATFSEEMVIELLNRYYPEGSIILDPFAGSGSTLVACKKNNRFAFGIEISPQQVKDFKNRNEGNEKKKQKKN